MRKTQVSQFVLGSVYSFAVDGGAVGSFPTRICPPVGSIITTAIVKFILETGNAAGTSLNLAQSGVSLIGGNLVAVGLIPINTTFDFLNTPPLVSDGTEVLFVINAPNAFTQGSILFEVHYNQSSQ